MVGVNRFDKLILISSPPFSDEYPLSLGKAVSKKNREGLQLQVQSLVYGETEFHTIGTFMEKIKTVYGRPDQVEYLDNARIITTLTS